MRVLPGASVKRFVHSPGQSQVTLAVVRLPSDARRLASMPALLAAAFQFIAGLAPAVSVAASLGGSLPLPGGRPPTKSTLTISGLRPAAPPCPAAAPVPPVAGGKGVEPAAPS